MKKKREADAGPLVRGEILGGVHENEELSVKRDRRPEG